MSFKAIFARLKSRAPHPANFSGANTQDAQFEGCIGLNETAKRDFKRRGAVFHDSEHQVSSFQWWVQYVVVPLAVALIGGGGFMSFVSTQKNDRPPGITPTPTPTTTLKPPAPK